MRGILRTKKKDVEKKLIKLKNKYTVKAKTPFDVRFLESGEFKFKGIDMSIEEVE